MNQKLDHETLEELRSVEDELRKLNPTERKDRFEELSSSEQKAFRQRHSVGRVEFSTEQEGNVLGEATRRAKVSAYSTIFTGQQKLWDWYLEAKWDYDGRTVSSVNVTDYANVHDWAWSYQGTVSKFTEEDEVQFEARRQGRLSCGAVWGALEFTANPYARVKGFSDGDFDVIEKSDSPTL